MAFSTTQQLAIHEATRKSLQAQLKNLEEYVVKLSGTSDVDAMQTRKLRAADLLKNFMYVEGQMFTVDPSIESKAIEFSERYYKVDSSLSKWIRQSSEVRDKNGNEGNATMSTTISMPQVPLDIRLPKITIEPFAGNYTQWQSFYDVYMKTIHNSNLTAVQKFTYLKGYLRDEAASLVKQFPITEANYFEAFKKLVDRYGRQKYTVQAFMRTFLNQPIIKQGTSTNIRKLLDVSDETLRGLKALGQQAESRDVWLLHIMESKLDAETKMLWAQHSCETDYPSVDEFFKFLLNRSDALEATKGISTRDSFNDAKLTKSFISTNNLKCWLCSGEHYLSNCDRFRDMPISERRESIKSKGCCFNCLKMNHAVFTCRSKIKCAIYFRKHNTLLHPDDGGTESGSNSSSNNQTSNAVSKCNSKIAAVVVKPSSTEDKETWSYSSVNVATASILPTAVVKITDKHGVEHRCRVLLDSGSMSSLISEKFSNQLGLTRIYNRTIVSGVGGSTSQTSRGAVHIKLRSRYNTEKEIVVVALVLANLCSQMPSHSVKLDKKEFPVFMADPGFSERGRIDLILGVGSVFDSLLSGRLRLDDGMRAVETIFGWVIGGEMTSSEECQTYIGEVQHQSTTSVDELLQRFWQIENLPEFKELTEEETRCEALFNETTERSSDGRFVVRLPFNQKIPDLGVSLNLARSRQASMERTFVRDKSFGLTYKRFMEEYLSLGHMVLSSCDTSKNYLPHHGVIKESSTTTKLRVVFDASVKTSNGFSLNEKLMAGTISQASLYQILLRFREFKIAMVCDVEKMYRQILVHPDDCKLQQIVWRTNSDEPLQYYELKTLTYGMKSAPFIATRVLEELARLNEGDYPEVSSTLRKNTYIDDVMFGANSLDEALGRRLDLIRVLDGAGMKLRKWVSNSTELLDMIPSCDKENLIKDFTEDDSGITKVLGLQWNPVDDVFSYKIELSKYVATKRGLLSESSRIFDPLGWLTPVVINLKILFQELWLKPVGWDDALPETVESDWLALRSKLQDLRSIKIPRWLTTSNQTELHGFCDASKRAYAAVVYTSHKTERGNFCTKLVAAKSKVAPIKTLSIARLELCAALLLVELMKSVESSLSITISSKYYWTDSTIVLDWLSNVPNRWEVFVANRTSKILQNTRREDWYHVPTGNNAADCASRGVMPNELINHELWWNGPSWLENKEDWPKQKYIEGTMSVLLNIHKEEDWLEDLALRISSFHTIIKVVARLIRLFQNARAINKKHPKTGSITREEIFEAELVCWRYVQNRLMKEDITNLTRSEPVKSNLKFLNPFIDGEGVVRVGGRLQNAKVPESVKHPLIIPTKTKLAKRLVEEYHLTYHHAGPQLLLGLLRQRYWIIRGKDIVKLVTRGCVSCFRVNPIPMGQQMGNLPSYRVEHIRPFIKVGIDFAGPFMVVNKRGRGQRPSKIYVCLFVCESTKAVHIELVLDLTSGAFLAALRRFVGRRGLCTDIYSDCGSNFIGANRERLNLFKIIKQNDKLIYYSLLKDSIQWHFMPPSAPHFGGLWEAAVKAFKYHFKRVVGATIVTVEEMMTLSIEIEAILNSRPLCGISDSPEDIMTPAHFLLGHSMVLIPEADLTRCPISKLDRWQLIQQLKQHFWMRWSIEYLTALQSRYKWETVKKNIQVDDVVLIIDNNLPPTKWLMGKVVDLIHGGDGLVRVINICTKSGLLKRPIHKVCRLPIESRDSRPGEC